MEYSDKENQDEPNVELMFVDKDEYNTIFEMVKMVLDEQKIFRPQNHLLL